MNAKFELPLYVLVTAGTIVFLQWDFLFDGVAALGLNLTLASALLLACLLKLQKSVNGTLIVSELPLRNVAAWFSPPVLVALSFSIYENVWLKQISIALLPIMFGCAIACSRTLEREHSVWDLDFIARLIRRLGAPIRFLNPAAFVLLQQFLPSKTKVNRDLFRQIVLGIWILIPLSTIAIFLLGNVDQAFFGVLDSFVSNIFSLFSSSLWLKIITTLVVSVAVIALLIGWSQTPLEVSINAPRSNDNLVAVAIVLLGLNVIYLLFLALQAEALFLNNLPKNLVRAQKLVKSGFWQLFMLSVLNICVFLFTQRKALKHAQLLVHLFVIASALLIVSACWRLGLYVYLYGLSHEKFFASYTALFSVIVFALLINASFSKHRKNLLKNILIMATWFYAIAALTPIETITFKTNLWLSEQADSRIDLYHLSLMSVDVKHLVEAAIESDLLAYEQWHWWLVEKEENYCDKEWYKFNVSRALNCDTRLK